MPRFEKDGITVETSIPREAARLRAEGFKETKARTAEVKKADSQKSDK